MHLPLHPWLGEYAVHPAKENIIDIYDSLDNTKEDANHTHHAAGDRNTTDETLAVAFTFYSDLSVGSDSTLSENLRKN